MQTRMLDIGHGRPPVQVYEAGSGDDLLYLHGAGGRPVGRDELLREVWGYSEEAATRTLETHVWRLRRKLAAAGAGGLLFTEAGGYRLARCTSP